MTRWLYSDQRAVIRRGAPFILAAGVLFTPAALAHPDLLAQIERLDEQVQAEPENSELLIRRGDLYRRHEDYAAAARDFRAARVLSPGHPELDFYQGRLALETGDFQSAAGLLDHYLAAHPHHPVGWRLRGETAMAQGDASAAANFERAIRFSQAASPELYRQWVLALLTAGDKSGALKAIDLGLGQLGVEVSLLGFGADVALTERDAERAGSYLKRLPVGLERLAPWSDRLGAVECLAAQTAGQENDPAHCTAGAAQRLDGQLQHAR